MSNRVLMGWNAVITVALIGFAFVVVAHSGEHKKEQQELLEYNSQTIEQMFEDSISSGRMEEKIRGMIDNTLSSR